MKILNIFQTLILAACVIFSGCAGTPSIPEHPSGLRFNPLDFKPPRIEDYRVVLPNGMVVYIAEDRELPTFDMTVMVRTGSMYEDADKRGLASMCGALMRRGGTEKYTADQIDEIMADLAGSLHTDIGFTRGSAGVSVLKEDVDKGLEMLAEVLVRPVFAEDEIRRYREQAIQGIEHRYDRPGTVLDDVAKTLVYGAHPAGRLPSKAVLQSITRDDLVAFHKKYFHPNNCIVAVAGDFNREEMLRKIQKAFEGWEKSEVALPAVKDVEPNFERGVYLINRDMNQGNVQITHTGIREDNPDLYAVKVMNTILGGGGFTSRITNRVRNEEGLAYSAGSGFNIPREYTGDFSCEFQTKCASVAYAASIAMAEINRIRTELVGEEELKRAKDLYIERFPSIFTGWGSTTYAKVSVLAENEASGRPLDYFETYCENFRKVTAEKVLEAAQKYLHPDMLKVVVVGKIEDMKKGDGVHAAKLEDFGPIKELTPPDLSK
jgi:predicted Zn-dependent peptidase